MDNNYYGYKGLLRVNLKDTISEKTFILSMVFSITIPILLSINGNIYDFLVKFIDVAIIIFPNLLGFSLGGIAIIIGFNNKKVIKIMSNATEEDKNITYYQKIISSFAWTVFIQAFNLLIVFIFWIAKTLKINFITNVYIVNIGNFVCLFIILITAFYSIFCIMDLIVSVNSFFQTSYILEQKTKKVKKPRK